MKAKKRLIDKMPLDRTFRAADVVDDVYPHLVRSDSEGRTYNMGVSAVARMLRHINGVVEIEHGVFYANKEYFSKMPPYIRKPRTKQRWTEDS